MLRFLLRHPLLNTPALSPAPHSPHPHRWHRSFTTSTDTHTPLHPPLQSCSREEIYCRPRLLWANTNKMLFCCNLFNWPQKRRLEHVQALPAPVRLPGSHMLSAPRSWPPLAVTTEDGTLGKRGIKAEGRPKEAAGLEKAGRSPPPAALLTPLP